MKEIVFRAVKITLATILAILLAQSFQLQNPMTAGVIAILNVIDTRIATFQTVQARLLSTALAFLLAYIFFILLGFNLLAFSLYLICYILLAFMTHLEMGIAPCTVLVTHFYLAKSVSWQWQMNGLLLMVIGGGMAILVASWVPSYVDQIKNEIKNFENQMKNFLWHLAQVIEDHPEGINQDEKERFFLSFQMMNDRLEILRKLAIKEYDNQIYIKNDYFIQYYEMRKRQMHQLVNMVHNLSHLQLSTHANQKLAMLLSTTATQFDEKNTGKELLKILGYLDQDFKRSPLPKSREEFESRAILYQMLRSFESFLEIKHTFYQTHQEDVHNY
ncbi:aromatic acid exporter family protein [Facklamia sp. DSM 111018]|uniref:Aromatic acid exporter family protein n=1 Tax=Facklamia lactis TaxID=2749967 RepID=A0ABS0LUR0_9LACT|nr:aromatic acid exporter family protein [Facklamia lactis]MBG9981418.1 aromatic acid exporter family protein [Facklamia lactis]MBG9987106.1 aromatic acid exporter family protein [Facklamia lactis]